MESAKLDIKELLLVTKIRNTNEKIKWLVIGSFLFALLVSTLVGITLFSRYLNNVMNTKHEDIIVKVEIPEAKAPLAFTYQPANTWSLLSEPFSSVKEPTKEPAATNTIPQLIEQKNLHTVKHKTNLAQLSNVGRKRAAFKKNADSVSSKTISASSRKSAANSIPPGYVKLRDDLYFDPNKFKYLLSDKQLKRLKQ
jgi:hypothetical protein